MFEHEEGPTVKEVFLDFRSQGVAAEQIGDLIRKLNDGSLILGGLTMSSIAWVA